MEVIGIDNDGCLIIKDLFGEVYNCGETLEQFGTDNLTDDEKEMLASGKYGPEYITLEGEV